VLQDVAYVHTAKVDVNHVQFKRQLGTTVPPNKDSNEPAGPAINRHHLYGWKSTTARRRAANPPPPQ
jgi:hypothetical protein